MYLIYKKKLKVIIFIKNFMNIDCLTKILNNYYEKSERFQMEESSVMQA